MRDLPRPHGSMRHLSARTVARIPNSTGVDRCWIDVATQPQQLPLRFVFHDLQKGRENLTCKMLLLHFFELKGNFRSFVINTSIATAFFKFLLVLKFWRHQIAKD